MKSEESEKREYPYCGACYNDRNTEVLVCCPSGLLKQIQLPLELHAAAVEVQTNYKLSCMEYCKSPALAATSVVRGVVCCGSVDGSLVLLPFPLQNDYDTLLSKSTTTTTTTASPSTPAADSSLQAHSSAVQNVHYGAVNVLRVLNTLDTAAASYGHGGRSIFGLPFPLLFTAGEDGCIFVFKMFASLSEIKSRPPSVALHSPLLHSSLVAAILEHDAHL
jgi:hypothetical protein